MFTISLPGAPGPAVNFLFLVREGEEVVTPVPTTFLVAFGNPEFVASVEWNPAVGSAAFGSCTECYRGKQGKRLQFLKKKGKRLQRDGWLAK
jgi:hypothetical protein